MAEAMNPRLDSRFQSSHSLFELNLLLGAARGGKLGCAGWRRLSSSGDSFRRGGRGCAGSHITRRPMGVNRFLNGSRVRFFLPLRGVFGRSRGRRWWRHNDLSLRRLRRLRGGRRRRNIDQARAHLPVRAPRHDHRRCEDCESRSDFQGMLILALTAARLCPSGPWLAVEAARGR